MHCTTLEGQSVNIRASSSDASLSAGNTILRYVQYIQFSIQPNIGIWDKEMISKISRSPPFFQCLHKNGSDIICLTFKRIHKTYFSLARVKNVCKCQKNLFEISTLETLAEIKLPGKSTTQGSLFQTARKYASKVLRAIIDHHLHHFVV